MTLPANHVTAPAVVRFRASDAVFVDHSNSVVRTHAGIATYGDITGGRCFRSHGPAFRLPGGFKASIGWRHPPAPLHGQMRYSSFSPTGLPRSLNEHVSLPPPADDPARTATDEPVQQAAPSERDDRYLVRIQSDPARALAEWHRLFDADTSIGPFQAPAWLASWYRTLGRQPGIDAIFATVLRASDGKALLGLPLLRRRSGGLRWIEPADLGVSDYNGPWLARDFPTERRVVERVLHALHAAMKLDADVLRMGKLPAQLGGQANPLLRFPQQRTCAMHDHLIRLQDDYAAWRRGQAKRHRKHLDRC